MNDEFAFGIVNGIGEVNCIHVIDLTNRNRKSFEVSEYTKDYQQVYNKKIQEIKDQLIKERI